MDTQIQKSQELEIIAKDSGLQQNKVETLLNSFSLSFQNAKDIVTKARTITVTDESQIELMASARQFRINLKNIRVEVENKRKELKEQSLREGKAIDGIANVIKALIIPIEEHLEKQEKFAEIKEAERKERAYSDRVEKLSKYVDDVSIYNLRELSEESFISVFNNAKKVYEEKLIAEQKETEEKIRKENEQREENERIRKENELLKKQAEENERKIELERLEIQKKLQAEIKARQIIENKIKEEKEKELRAEQIKKEIEEQKIKLQEEAQRKALLAPDKNKLIDLASEIEKITLPAVKSNEAGQIIKNIDSKLIDLVSWIRNEAKKL